MAQKQSDPVLMLLPNLEVRLPSVSLSEGHNRLFHLGHTHVVELELLGLAGSLNSLQSLAETGHGCHVSEL